MSYPLAEPVGPDAHRAPRLQVNRVRLHAHADARRRAGGDRVDLISFIISSWAAGRAAVDVDGESGGEGGFVARKTHRECGDFPGNARPSDRLAGDEGGDILLARFTEADILAGESTGPKSKSELLVCRSLGIKPARGKA
jgi:hypothetical protein